MKLYHTIVLASTLLLGIGCGSAGDTGQQASSSPASEVKTVFVSNYPHYYLVSRMAPDAAQVFYPIEGDIDPAFWRPTLAEVEKMAEYDLLLLNGAGYEQWLQWVILPEERVVKTAATFRDQWIRMEDAIVHSHGPDGEHSHGTVNFNTWLDPILAEEQARNIATALITNFPEAESSINLALEDISIEFQELDRQFKETTSTSDSLTLFTSHPVYTYWGKRYGVTLVDFHWEPDTFPSEAEWEAFDRLLETHEVEFMLWEAEPDPRTRAELVKRRIYPVVFSTANAKPDGGDYMSVMRENNERLKNALQRR